MMTDRANQVAPAYGGAELAVWTGGDWDGAAPAVCTGVTQDTRTLKAGALYVALAGERFDGHAFVAQAAEGGAAAAVVRRDWLRPAGLTLPLLRVDAPGDALCAMGVGYRRQLAPHLVGITGTAGKTTVKEMIARLFRTRVPTAANAGNWNNRVGLPLSLLAMPPDTNVGVFEIGTNHPGEIAELAGMLAPAWGVVTNVGPGHIEHFGSVAAIAREKADLLRALPVDGVAFLDADGPWYATLREAVPCACVTISSRGDADYVMRERAAGNARVVVEESATGERIALRLSLPGPCQASNALLAVAVARRYGLAGDAIAAAFHADVALPMRWQRDTVAGAIVINDAYNANPLSMRAALLAFAEEPADGARWLVLGSMRELGAQARAEHEALGAVAAGGPWDGLITVGEDGNWIADGARTAGWPAARLHPCATVDEAVRVVVENVKDGDLVLLKASRGQRLEALLEGWRASRGN